MAFKLKKLEPTEKQIQASILEAIRKVEIPQGRVIWVERMNSGATVYESKGKKRFIRYGFKGCPDIHGALTDGRALYLEVKSPSGKVGKEQRDFMDLTVPPCVGGIVRSADEAIEIIRSAFTLRKQA